MLKTFKYRIYPNNKQKQLIEDHFNATRLVYNLSLEAKMYAYNTQKVSVSSIDLINQLPELKEEFKFLNDVNAQSLQTSIRNLDKAYKNFFNGFGFPKFKNKNNKQSFNCVGNTRKVDFDKQRLTIPKISNIKIKIDRIFTGTIKTITISKSVTNKYYASILIDNHKDLPEKSPIKNVVGIDLGISSFLTTNSGFKIDNPRYLRNSIDRLKILQKRSSKKKIGSNNRKKANLKVSLLHEKITNRRLDFLHKLTKQMVDDNQIDTFVLENLKVSNMIKNHKLAQSISDVSWGKFTEILKYKCEWSGKNLILVDPKNTSKTCSNCGNIKKDLTLKDRIYNCECGLTVDRDVNAAVNIKNKTGQVMPEEPVEMSWLQESVKQEDVCLV